MLYVLLVALAGVGFQAGFSFGDSKGLLAGIGSALLGGLLSIPVAKAGEGFKRIGVPGPRVPAMTTAVGAGLGYGLGALAELIPGAPPALREWGAQIGTQAGLMAPQAHDRGWHQSRRAVVDDVSSVVLPKRKGK